ncbi:MAG: hypothetical protein KatS3mg073_1565 [Meiothermus sp.]|nr:MAG: hypothetical protein KatS3mg073_1565 [Meiothermus sp.]
MREAGAVMLTDDGRTNEDAGVLAQGLQYAASWGLLVSVHAEDAGLRRGGVMHEGKVSFRLGLPGNPAYAESARIARDLEVVRYVIQGPGMEALEVGKKPAAHSAPEHPARPRADSPGQARRPAHQHGGRATSPDANR